MLPIIMIKNLCTSAYERQVRDQRVRADATGDLRRGSQGRKGELQCRAKHVHGNPYLWLVRSEVESLVKYLRGERAFR